MRTLYYVKFANGKYLSLSKTLSPSDLVLLQSETIECIAKVVIIK